MKTSPASATSSPAITRRSVDLPLPLGPSSAVSEPLSTSIETSSSATKSPKCFVTLRASIAKTVTSLSEYRHQDQREDRERRKQHGGRVGGALVRAVLVGRLHVLRQCLRPSRKAARDDRHRPELA